MATAMRGLLSSSLRRGVVRSFSSSSGASFNAASGVRASTPAALGVGMLFAGVSAKLGVDHFPRFLLAKCETKMDQLDAVPPTVEADADAGAEATSSSADASAGATSIRSRADELYSAGQLAEAYELLNENPATKEDAALLFRLAQTTHKLSMAAPQPERRRVLNDEALLIVMKAAEEAGRQIGNKSERADILALYGAVIQHRAHRKQGAEKKQLMALAQEHMTAALREDAVNFNANYALADLHYELAQERTELGRKSLSSMAIFDKTNNNKLSESDQESLWRATARHAYVALKAKPDDIHCINFMAQSKFAIGDLPSAKKYTLRAMAAEQKIKFADEKNSAKQAKDLMDKINVLLAERNWGKHIDDIVDKINVLLAERNWGKHIDDIVDKINVLLAERNWDWEKDTDDIMDKVNVYLARWMHLKGIKTKALKSPQRVETSEMKLEGENFGAEIPNPWALNRLVFALW